MEEHVIDVEMIISKFRNGLQDSPEELINFITTASIIAEDYKKAVNEGIKKRSTTARKALLAIKKMANDMRKTALEAKNQDTK